MKLKKLNVAVLGLTVLIMGSGISVFAEEKEPAGYHVYEKSETSVSDTWYSVARGDHLLGAIVKLDAGSSAKYASCSGTTLAHRPCDRVYVRIYLDKSDNGVDGWGNVNYWTSIAYDKSTAHVSMADYEITRGKYYSVQGSHSVTEGEDIEMTTTSTDSLYFD